MKPFILFVFLNISLASLYGQNVGIGTSSPNQSSILELRSSSQGLLIPRMTLAQKNGISFPAEGLMIYQTDVDTGFYFFKGIAWKSLNTTVNTPSAPILNLLIYYKLVGSETEIWTAKYDGTNRTKVNLTLPVNTEMSDDVPPQLSPDGVKIFFTLRSTLADQFGTELYSCNINGSGVLKIIDKGGNDNYIILGGVN